MARKKTFLFLMMFFVLQNNNVSAQSLSSNRTKQQARQNKEQSFADTQRKIFDITSWAGANISELLNKWGQYTSKSLLPNGLTVYRFESNYSGSGGSYDLGYVVTDPYGNVIASKESKDNTYSYNFTDFYEFFVDKNNLIIHVKTGTK